LGMKCRPQNAIAGRLRSFYFCDVFIKVFSKNKKSTGDQKLYYRLCESYRTDTSVRHLYILYLGTLEELPMI